VWEKYFDNPFLFTTTFGGNPLSMSAAIACLATIEGRDDTLALLDSIISSIYLQRTTW
jgi:acetylornithine/succinyldiaminopimelate/putrescine aminotransferase